MFSGCYCEDTDDEEYESKKDEESEKDKEKDKESRQIRRNEVSNDDCTDSALVAKRARRRILGKQKSRK